jgi:hypothetical protein
MPHGASGHCLSVQRQIVLRSKRLLGLTTLAPCRVCVSVFVDVACTIWCNETPLQIWQHLRVGGALGLLPVVYSLLPVIYSLLASTAHLLHCTLHPDTRVVVSTVRSITLHLV